MGGVTFAGAGGSSAISLIDHTTGAGASSHSGALTCPNATLYTIEITDGNSPTTFVPVSDDNANTWVSATPQGFASGGGASQQYYSYHKGAGALVTTAGNTSLVNNGNFPAWSFECWGNTKTGASTPFDTEHGSATASSATSIPGSVTPGADGSLAITIGAGYTSSSNAISAGWTLLANQPLVGGSHFSEAMGYQVQTTATAANPTWTFSGTQSFVSSTTSIFKQGP